MFTTIGKWVAKKAAGHVARTGVAIFGGSKDAQEIAAIAAELAVAEMLGN